MFRIPHSPTLLYNSFLSPLQSIISHLVCLPLPFTIFLFNFRFLFMFLISHSPTLLYISFLSYSNQLCLFWFVSHFLLLSFSLIFAFCLCSTFLTLQLLFIFTLYPPSYNHLCLFLFSQIHLLSLSFALYLCFPCSIQSLKDSRKKYPYSMFTLSDFSSFHIFRVLFFLKKLFSNVWRCDVEIIYLFGSFVSERSMSW